ncbi:MAG: hypothetical protein ACLQNE_29415 [Thermoguttaceae bacterium]|jgi:hypothetical protein
MATVYKRTQRKPLPDDAVLVERRGEKWSYGFRCTSIERRAASGPVNETGKTS